MSLGTQRRKGELFNAFIRLGAKVKATARGRLRHALRTTEIFDFERDVSSVDIDSGRLWYH
ncbi:hypothetical protein PYK22_00538 [Pyrinomonas methylaliphatogenes]|uniref:Uncharacterized protein n=1 Tax=Pyrinomonas methylaliphatogenes TaxID=454194 RepID=A0A0B6WW98_9BACT|nr:hypothetical protein PYK22_00538 [Pyrinomonas methylaliphatogenes]